MPNAIHELRLLYLDYRWRFNEVDWDASVAAWICDQLGHELIQDQCGKPEHDYCRICDVRREEIPGM